MDGRPAGADQKEGWKVLTYEKAKSVLEPNDDVFVVDRGRVKRARVKKIFMDSLATDAGILDFISHGWEWYLTEKVAKEKAGRGFGI